MEKNAYLYAALAHKETAATKLLDRTPSLTHCYRWGWGLLRLLAPAVVFGTAGQVLALPANKLPGSISEATSSVRYIAQALPTAAIYGYSEPFLSLDSEGEGVRRLQQQLQNYGYYFGSIDGIYGSQTEDAVRRFQQANGLFVDGVVGEDTQLALDGRGVEQPIDFTPGSSPNPFPPVRPGSVQPVGFCPNQVGTTSKRYIVLIPSEDADRLLQVRRYYRDAFIARSPLGAYIQAGACPDRGVAENRSRYLRQVGFRDAQVRYF